MPTGPYATRMRNLVRASGEKRVVLDFWANDIRRTLTNDFIAMYLEHPESFTACHNVANTLVSKMGTGDLTELQRSRRDDFAPAVAGIRNGGYVMEIKFHADHSVCLVSRAGETHVEHFEAWAGAGTDLGSVAAYLFTKSVFDDYEDCRPTRGDAADALAGLAAGTDLAENVGTLTRCNAEACGIGHDPFNVTVKYKALRSINDWEQETKREIKAWTEKLSEVVYHADHDEPHKLRCRVCLKKKGRGRAHWWHCDDCEEVYCNHCAPVPEGRRGRRKGKRNHNLEQL